MTESVRPKSVLARFPVEVEREPETLAARLTGLSPMLPAGHLVLLTPCGFAYKREPDAFSAIASGAALGMSIMLAEFTVQVSYFSVVGRVLAVLFFVAAPILFARFLARAMSAWEVTSSGRRIRIRRTLAGRTRQEIDIDADQITAVIVVKDETKRYARVALGGPRHEMVAELYVIGALDPDALAPFLAEMVSIVARHASAAPA